MSENYVRQWLADDATEAAFLLGGIGTGNVSLRATGSLSDWEIYNRPDKGNKPDWGFFTIWAKEKDHAPVMKVLESRLRAPYSANHGMVACMASMPRLDSARMAGEYPFAWVEFKDGQLPVQIRLMAFTPFIPLDEDNSGIPAFVLRYEVENIARAQVEVTISGCLPNLNGFEEYNAMNEYRDEMDVRGLAYYAQGMPQTHLKYGSMALLTRDPAVTYKTQFLDWGRDGIQDYWEDLKDDGLLRPQSVLPPRFTHHKRKTRLGALGIHKTLLPGEKQAFEFIVAWHYPNRVKSWKEDCCCEGCACEITRNYYSTQFTDAWAAGVYLARKLDTLEILSRKFHDALFESTLPHTVIDALAANITVIRSPTCFRIENGTFMGYEGCNTKSGCCEGNCTHVWNYAQTLAFLFPKLERSMRRIEYNLETDAAGNMAFRTHQVFGAPRLQFHPAADGQLGTIVRLYRDWKLCGDDAFLREVWENAARSLDFAFSYWDTDGDFIIDGQQHNTYDIEFYGQSSMLNSIFYAALKAGSQMAHYLKDEDRAQRYDKAWRKGSELMDALLWNGNYYVQCIDDVDEYRHQYGNGCLADQLFGQYLAHVAGLGHILPQEHVKRAIYSVYANNFKKSMDAHESVQRAFALNDEAGLLLCTWPCGGRPKLPFIYSDEVWTGVEYQVAAHLIFEGYVEEGISIVQAVRGRHDGYRRNPWNECECGNHYVRSMASWALLIALSGFRYDLCNDQISFRPMLNADDFAVFYSTGKQWGIYRQRIEKETGELLSWREVLYDAQMQAQT